MKNYFLFVLLLNVFCFKNLSAEEVIYKDEEYSVIKTDGQLVPVGEVNRYRNSYKTWNIWTNPFGYFFGSFNVGGSYAFHPNMKVNVEPNWIYFYSSDPKIVGGGLTASMSIFFKKVYDGFYLEPGARFLYLTQERTVLGDIDGVIGGPQLIGGWGWYWDSGFNINLGLGIGYYWGDAGDDFDDTDSFSGIVPAGNLQFGFAF